MSSATITSLDAWRLEFAQLAAERGLQWLIGSSPETHRHAYESGASPADELASLADMAEWRGCGCGGGG